MAIPKKYKFDNGVMQLNPEYAIWKAKEKGEKPPPKKKVGDLPLAIVSSMEDVSEASEEQHIATGTSFRLAESTVASLEIMQDEEFVEEFSLPSGEIVDASQILDGLTDYFTKFEVPVGLINKLMALKLYHLRFIIDDSGSMRSKTNVTLQEASHYTLRGQEKSDTIKMTRWQEAESRLHDMLDILAFIPTKSIEMRFMNAKNIISLQRAGKTMKQFSDEAHFKIASTFQAVDVKYQTPTLRVLTAAFEASTKLPDPTMHYLMTDGVPSDSSVEQVADLITNRHNPSDNPLTLISCSNENSETEWMKIVEEAAPFCAELDDYEDEKEEVLTDQGVAFPYTKGYWLISQLVAAINPNDLDAIDENVPFTKNTLDNMLGRIHSPKEFQYYFERNPHASIYLDLYSRFLNDETFARNFISKDDQDNREKSAGYQKGKPTRALPSPQSLAKKLVRITSASSSVLASDIPTAKAVHYVS